MDWQHRLCPGPAASQEMRLNSLEYRLMNNPLREYVQRKLEARQLLKLGGRLGGGAALEMGCGCGVGTEIILDHFGADSVDAFDLDSRMVSLAKRRLASRGSRIRLWIGSGALIAVADSTYDAVFDFGVIHHIERWMDALSEVERVLRPGGRFYAEEPLRRMINHPVARRLVDHPGADRFNGDEFAAGLKKVGLRTMGARVWWDCFAWFVAVKPEER
jgi:ubiquinone/menaquinone biosynthesis C-methylase UbiE